MQDIIITGLPRAGTTLLAAMVDEMPDSVCLNEPLWQYEWAKKHAHLGPESFAGWLKEDMAGQRKMLLAGEPIMDRRRKDGKAVTNYFREDHEQKEAINRVGMVPFTRDDLSVNFTLAAKHNILYLSALEEIAKQKAFKIIAIIRHPLGVISSWQTTPIPISRGELPAAMIYWQQMRKLVATPMELLEKQVRMYDLMCAKLYALREQISIIKYEDLIEKPSLFFEYISKPAPLDKMQLQARNPQFYDTDIDAISKTLKTHGQHYQNFYDI